MSVAVPSQAINKIASSKDPKATILEIVGDLKGVEITGDMVLLGTYIRPEMTAGGIIRPGMNVEEDVWQGKVGLVLKWGTTAYRDALDYSFDDADKIKPGEWAVYRVGDAWSVQVNGMSCRLVRDVNLRMRVKNPEIVF